MQGSRGETSCAASPWSVSPFDCRTAFGTVQNRNRCLVSAELVSKRLKYWSEHIRGFLFVRSGFSGGLNCAAFQLSRSQAIRPNKWDSEEAHVRNNMLLREVKY
mmetsp:Transcript_49821/g.131108  ORF Transcript_49821/g.131108 Transcript_49821/m.131108 type:complete len:104 (-) Transcript_49821:190-501(-)